MSTKYPGGFITKSPVAPTSTAASGVWTLDQQQQAQRAGTWPSPPNYIEDVFSTWLYTGNGSTQTIPNGIDLAGKGGLVWTKTRNVANSNWFLDTVRGGTQLIRSNTTEAQFTDAGTSITFGSSSYAVGSGDLNTSTQTQVSWTFREQPKFFDVVTYTGTGTNRTIAHNLGSAPGCVIIKCTSQAYVWAVYHRGMTSAAFAMQLQATDAQSSEPTYFNSTAPTSTVFSVGTANATNQSGQTYVAYLFAHNAGGFGLSGTDNVISCGSYAGNGSTTGPTVTLGYEPQWLLIKNITLGTQNWAIHDNMRGLSYSTGVELRPNTSDPEFVSTSRLIRPLSTGFQPGAADDAINATGSTYIYVAIRRGPMKTPTTGTSVFAPVAQASFNAYSVGFPTDLAMGAIRGGNALNTAFGDRLRGGTQYLVSSSTAAEANDPGGLFYFDLQNSMDQGLSSASSIFWNFRRAPGFFDEVCYTGTGSNKTETHNLGVAPELMIIKGRNIADVWPVYAAPLGNTKRLVLSGTNAELVVSTFWNNTSPTSTVFTVGTNAAVNNSGSSYVAYLFASAPGVSKVGSYTGTGTTQVINCGFTAGSRFVLIKRTDSTGDWYVWDSARGIVAGNDPYLLLNSTAAEVTNTDFVDTAASGFEISSTAPAAINASGGTFIFLAIA